MASDRRYTQTERIAHAVCDRYLPPLPQTEQLKTTIAAASFTPEEAQRMHTAANLADGFFSSILKYRGGK